MDGDDVLWYLFLVWHCFNTALDGERRYGEILVSRSCWHPFEILLRTYSVPSWRYLFSICVTVSRYLLLLVVKSRLYCTKEDGVSVPVWIIINTNESIELDWIHMSSPMEGVDGVLYRIDLFGSVVYIFILHQVDVPNILVLYSRAERRLTN